MRGSGTASRQRAYLGEHPWSSLGKALHLLRLMLLGFMKPDILLDHVGGTLSPTVRAKYPSSQNSPPHNCLRTSENPARISPRSDRLQQPPPPAQSNTSGESSETHVHGLYPLPTLQSQTRDAPLSREPIPLHAPAPLIAAPTCGTWAPTPDDSGCHRHSGWHAGLPTPHFTRSVLPPAAGLFLPALSGGASKGDFS